MSIVAGSYQVEEKIGEGGFGEVFSAYDIHSGFPVAIKREPIYPNADMPQLLINEANAYKILDGLPGLPNIYHYGQEGEYFVLVMDCLGPSLKQLAGDFNRYGSLPIKNVVFAAVSLIARLEAVHERGLVFRDMKPDQVCVGNYSAAHSHLTIPRPSYHQQYYPPSPDESYYSQYRQQDYNPPPHVYNHYPPSAQAYQENTPPTYYPDSNKSKSKNVKSHHHQQQSQRHTHYHASPPMHYDDYFQQQYLPPQFSISNKPQIYLIDFGLSRSFVTSTGHHIANERLPPRSGKTGTARYASINVHKGRKHTRRDDLESLAYCLIELCTGKLPWSSIQAKTSEQGWRKIGYMKQDIPISELCNGIPSIFGDFLQYTRSLGFYERPDYELCRGQFIRFYQRYWGDDYRLQWKEPTLIKLTKEDVDEEIKYIDAMKRKRDILENGKGEPPKLDKRSAKSRVVGKQMNLFFASGSETNTQKKH